MSSIQFPGYRVISQLGTGGMSAVYLAEQLSFGRMVALKVLTANRAETEHFGVRFLREARIAAHLSHPNIVSVYDTGNVEGNSFLAMEYLPGGDLSTRIHDGIALLETLDIVVAMADAVDYASEHGVIHRDIKPSNIMFRADGSIALVDFGIARDVHSEVEVTQHGNILGTPHYMSPEQCLGEELDLRSDLYSVGVVFFELLSGQVPFTADSGAAVGVLHVTGDVPQLPDSTGIFQDVINLVLAKNPEERYQTGADLIADIEALREELPDDLKSTILLSKVQGTLGGATSRTSGRKTRRKRTGPRRSAANVQDAGPISHIVTAAVATVVTLFVAWLFYWYALPVLWDQKEGKGVLQRTEDSLEAAAPFTTPALTSQTKSQDTASAEQFIGKAQAALSAGLVETAAVYIELVQNLEVDSTDTQDALAQVIMKRERILQDKSRQETLFRHFEEQVKDGAFFSPESANAYLTLSEIRTMAPEHARLPEMQNRVDNAASRSVRRLFAEGRLKQARASIELLRPLATEGFVTDLQGELDAIYRNKQSIARRLDQLHSEAKSLTARVDKGETLYPELIAVYREILRLDAEDEIAQADLLKLLTAELEFARQALNVSNFERARKIVTYLQTQAPEMTGLKSVVMKLEHMESLHIEAVVERGVAIRLLESLPDDFRTDKSVVSHGKQAQELIKAYRAVFRAEQLEPGLGDLAEIQDRIDGQYSERFYAHANSKGIELARIYTDSLAASGLDTPRIKALSRQFSAELESLKKKRRSIFQTF